MTCIHHHGPLFCASVLQFPAFLLSVDANRLKEKLTRCVCTYVGLCTLLVAFTMLGVTVGGVAWGQRRCGIVEVAMNHDIMVA